MKKLWLAMALFLMVPGAAAQETACKIQIQIANAMMHEFQEQMRLMSSRAAQYYGRTSLLQADLDAMREKTTPSKEQKEKSK